LQDSQEDPEGHSPAINAGSVTRQVTGTHLFYPGKMIVHNSEEIKDLAGNLILIKEEEDIDLLAQIHHLHQAQIVLTDIEGKSYSYLDEEENKKR
jgi:predicted ribosome-associated RNA-binding protein Tma20